MTMQYPEVEAVVECVVDAKNMIGEGAVWDNAAQCLWWLDVLRPSKLFCYDPATSETKEWEMPEMIASISPRKYGQGLLIASHSGINTFDPSTGAFSHVLNPEPGKPFNRCNDGASDANGNFWFGTMQNNIAPNGDLQDIVEPSGSLFRLSPDYVLTEMEVNVGISNTACWSPDNRLFYFCDSLLGNIYVYDFDRDNGGLSNRRIFSNIDRGVPDGSAMDAEGYLWNARWGAGCVVRFAPDGSVDKVVNIPCENVTSCAFGGKNLDTLYITTAKYCLSTESLGLNPLSGGLFAY